jgi:predicted O-methyltransferase YrrM
MSAQSEYPLEDTVIGSVARPIYPAAPPPCVAASCYRNRSGEESWYPPAMIGADTIAVQLFSGGYVKRALALMRRLTPDAYTQYLSGFYREGLRRFGRDWRYADIVTVLLCLADVLKPTSCLEIGIRRGRSAAAVAWRRPDCALALFDMWVPGYAGMDNPGSSFVRGELTRVGHRGIIEFIDGDSHQTLPAFFARRPEPFFDLITVDGDHSIEGAAQDLADVLPRLKVGGALVLDDVCHPAHAGLAEVWRRIVLEDPRFSAFTYRDAGYGVGFAVRKF